MIIEHRTYQLETSAVDRYFATFGQLGFDLQVRHMARSGGHFVTEIGSHSQIVALWEHESFEARQQGRRRLQQEPEWQDIIARCSPMIRSIESKLLVPSPVFQPRLRNPAYVTESKKESFE